MRAVRIRTSLLAAGIVFSISLTSNSSLAQTADGLKTRFADFLGPNTYAYMVWQRQGGAGKPEPYYEGIQNYLMFVDSKVGEVKTYKNKGGYFTEPSFTPDGARIVYYSMTTKDIRIMDRDGANDKSLITGYGMLGDTWKSSDGKQWIIAGRISGYTSGDCNYQTVVTVERIEIDNTGNKVTVATNAYPHNWEAYDCRPIDWAGLSPDGNYLIGGFPRYGYLGIYNTQQSTLTQLTINGCWISMAQDGSNNIMWCDEPQGHKGIYITDINQKEILKQSHSSILPSGGSYEALRWTPNRDYITYAGITQQWSYNVPNPRLVRLSDLKYVAVVDNYQYAQGNADVFFYGSGAVATSHRTAPASRVAKNAPALIGRVHDLRGRLLSPSASRAQSGVFFSSRSGDLGGIGRAVVVHE